MSKFNVGDMVKRVEGYKSEYWKEIKKQTGKEDSDTYKVTSLDPFEVDNIHCRTTSFNYKLVTEDKETLKKEKMEEGDFEAVKDMPKEVLQEANEKVLEEIKDERVAKAMTCLRGMYNEKNTLEQQTKEANNKIKEITKDLKVVNA